MLLLVNGLHKCELVSVIIRSTVRSVLLVGVCPFMRAQLHVLVKICAKIRVQTYAFESLPSVICCSWFSSPKCMSTVNALTYGWDCWFDYEQQP